jgi:DNA polymerase I-like protein with 3'-5' exonuclease and polymerase domains
VVSILPDGREEVYTMSVDDPTHRYMANGFVSGNSSDMCVLSMIRAKKRLEEAGLECWPVIFVHDSITFTCAYNDIEAAAKIIKEEMVRSPYKAVALDTELKVMPRWGNVEDMLDFARGDN